MPARLLPGGSPLLRVEEGDRGMGVGMARLAIAFLSALGVHISGAWVSPPDLYLTRYSVRVCAFSPTIPCSGHTMEAREVTLIDGLTCDPVREYRTAVALLELQLDLVFSNAAKLQVRCMQPFQKVHGVVVGITYCGYTHTATHNPPLLSSPHT